MNESMLETLKNLMSLDEVVFLLGVFAILFMTIIQKASKKFKPWTWLAEQFGKAANKEVIEKVEKIEKKVESLEKSDNDQNEALSLTEAKASRRRIINAADEIRREIKHSEEWFNEVLDDIHIYEVYCQDHPKYQNAKAKLSIEYINETWKKLMEKNAFL